MTIKYILSYLILAGLEQLVWPLGFLDLLVTGGLYLYCLS